MSAGLILFAHGARDPRWAQAFEAVAARVRELQPGSPVLLAYLELMTPSLEEAAQSLVAMGCTRIAVQPLFLGSGGHVRQDLPRLLDELRQRHSGVDWQTLSAIGETPSVLEAMAQAAAQALQSPAPTHAPAPVPAP